MISKAETVEQYLAELPEDRREAIETLRQIILRNVEPFVEERMMYGQICYVIPHSVYPEGYHCDPKMPLTYSGLASQKNYLSVYSMCTYADGPLQDWFREAWAATGKKLDMGKSCIRFKKLNDAPLDVIEELFRRTNAADFIAYYDANKPKKK